MARKSAWVDRFVFISSTFRDMHAERDYLHHVFRELQVIDAKVPGQRRHELARFLTEKALRQSRDLLHRRARLCQIGRRFNH